MKIRTPSAAQSAQLEALGATRSTCRSTQIYNNLDRGVIDASMIPMSAALDFKLIEVAKYFTIDAPLGRSPFLVAMNRGALREAARRPEEGHRRHHRPASSASRAPQTYDKKNNEALAAAKKDREVITLSAAGAQALGRRVQADDPAARSRRARRPACRRAAWSAPTGCSADAGRATSAGGGLGRTGTTEEPEGALRPLSALAGARRRLGAHALMGYTVLDVVLRYVFNRPFSGSLEITEFAMSVIVFLGIAYCGWVGGHVAVDILERPLEDPRLRFVPVILTFVSAVLFAPSPGSPRSRRSPRCTASAT